MVSTGGYYHCSRCRSKGQKENRGPVHFPLRLHDSRTKPKEFFIEVLQEHGDLTQAQDREGSREARLGIERWSPLLDAWIWRFWHCWWHCDRRNAFVAFGNHKEVVGSSRFISRYITKSKEARNNIGMASHFHQNESYVRDVPQDLRSSSNQYVQGFRLAIVGHICVPHHGDGYGLRSGHSNHHDDVQLPRENAVHARSANSPVIRPALPNHKNDFSQNGG